MSEPAEFVVEAENNNGRALAVPTPMHLIELALNKGASADELGKLMELEFRWKAEQQRIAYVEAMDQFKKNLPQIERTKNVTYRTSNGEASYWHVELDKANEIIGPALQAVGIAHTWKLGESNGKIQVTCVFQHKMGHREEVASLTGPPDTSGSKNSVQAIGSTTFYLERYTLLAGAGIAPIGKTSDNDGKTQGMAENAFRDYMTSIEDAANLEELQPRFVAAYKAARDIGDKQSMDAFAAAKDKKRAGWRK